MDSLQAIGERALSHLEEKNAARDRALQTSRMLTRHCAHAIRAVHRGERQSVHEHLDLDRRLLGVHLCDEVALVDGVAGLLQIVGVEHAQVEQGSRPIATDGDAHCMARESGFDQRRRARRSVSTA